jgi:hypothetical protein
MQLPIFFACAGLTCGLFAATWSVHPQSDPTTVRSSIQALDSTPQDPAPSAQAPQETDRERLERKMHQLLKDNGTEAMQKRVMQGMLGQFEKQGLPPEFGEKFMARFDLDHVMDLAAKVYVDHLDEATIDAIMAFYATPGGRKLAEATPDITVELTQASMEYGQKIGLEVVEEMRK